jgi:hypothetical protein
MKRPSSAGVTRVVKHIIRILWIAACVWLLVRTSSLRFASSKAFGDAEEVGYFGMMVLSWPLSIPIFSVYSHLRLSWWSYPDNDLRSIASMWLLFFAAGYFQWFILIPWIVQKGAKVYDHLLLSFRKKS